MNKDMNREKTNINKAQRAVPKKPVNSSEKPQDIQDVNYLYYSKVLEKPFESISELAAAEDEYFAKIKAKEDKAAQKKADALLVEEAFITLNNTRRKYKEALRNLTEDYSANLVKLKEDFEAKRSEIQEIMAKAEEAYSEGIKAFTDKYPEGYHLTLKDGDFETTISGSSTKTTGKAFDTNKAFQMIDWLFNI